MGELQPSRYHVCMLFMRCHPVQSSVWLCPCTYIPALFLSQRPQSAAAQLTLSDSVGQEDKQSSEGAWSLPVSKADESKKDGVDGPALSKSVDDMLLATGGADVETGFVSSHTTGLETLLSQVCM